MITWNPDTCYCSIKCISPSVNGEFIERCDQHKNSRRTTEVYDFNLFFRLRSNELDSERRPTDGGRERKRLLKESTRRRP